MRELRLVQRPAPGFGRLATVREVLSGAGCEALADYDDEALQALGAMARYVAEFLTAPHADLGRTGAVCPFAARAVAQDQVRLTACSVEGVDAKDQALVAEGMARLRRQLALPDGADPVNRAIVVVFPRLAEPEGARMIETIQRSLKLSFVERRLMIGQFYPACPEPGLWNTDFRPLQSPVISLAIRNITIFDAPFMLERPAYVEAYLRTFGAAGAARIEKAAWEVARAAGDQATARTSSDSRASASASLASKRSAVTG